MTTTLSASSGRKVKGSIPARPFSEIIHDATANWDSSIPIEVTQGSQQFTTHGGLLVIRQAWEIVGLDDLLQQAGIEKQDGVPAAAVAFLQTTAPLFGRGTVRDAIGQLKQDPALAAICGASGPFAKQVPYRFLGNENFDFQKFNHMRVDRLQEIRETRFKRDGIFLLDGSLLRKTSMHFEGIRHLYDHVTNSYLPAFDSVCILYAGRNVEVPVSMDLRILTEAQAQYYNQLKAQSFDELLECAKKCSKHGTIFIPAKDFATAHVKRSDRAGITWIGRITQKLPLEFGGELVTAGKVLKELEKTAFVKHDELGTAAACCEVKLPAYGRRVKLFVFRNAKGKSRQLFLTGSLELDELGFQELLHQLRDDFGEDKLDLALAEFRRLHDMGTETHRVAFDQWFLCLRFCNGLAALNFDWYSQAGDRDQFKIRGKLLKTQDIIRAYQGRAKKVRGLPGIKGKKIRAQWPGFGTVQLVVVVEEGRKPYLLVTSELTAHLRPIIARYKRRWRIEVFFRESKQNENLEGFRVRSLRAIKAHLSLVLLTHTLSKLLTLIDDTLMEKSIGEIKEEVINIAAIVMKKGKKFKIVFSDTFEHFYLMDCINSRARSRKLPARAPN